MWKTTLADANRLATATTAAAALLLGGPPSGPATAETLNGRPPERAIVSQPSATVFSGPGQQYYPTATLPAGTEVEVHRAVGDFLGIRPPAGSYSWATGADIQDLSPGVGIILRDQLASRVGSRLSDQRSAVQVRLDKGERVRVLARRSIDGVEWAQIAPPAGEFRWVRADAVTIGGQEPPLTTNQSAPAPQPLRESAPLAPAAEAVATGTPPGLAHEEENNADDTAIVIPTDAAEPAEFLTDAKPISGWVEATTHEEPGAPRTDARAISPAAPAPTPPTAPLPPTATTAGETTPSLAAAPPAEALPRDLQSLEIELARRVAQPAHLWRLDDIEIAASRFIAAATTVPQRSAGADLAERAGRFAAIGRRARRLSGVAPPVRRTRSAPASPPAASPPSGPAPIAAAGRQATPPGVATNTPYNAVGELRPVASKRTDAPRFALVDRRGRVTAFVSPPAGVDLQPLVGRHVAVTGQQGYMPRLRTAHVSATRVDLAPR